MPPFDVDEWMRQRKGDDGTPFNLEEWMRKRQEAKATPFKPKFIPKAERERMARAKEEAERKGEEERRLQEQQRWEQKDKERLDRERHDREKLDRERHNRARHPSSAADARPTAASGKGQARPPNETFEEREAAMLRERYYGPTHGKSTFSAKKRKRTAGNKFNFDWDPEEDTSPHPDDPRYQRQEPVIEHREVATQAKRPKKDVFGKHWSEKELGGMQQRDWRIFKEDYDISMKGGSLPNPMRSWIESGIPKRLLDVVSQVGYTDPSPIQRAAIPIALQSRDLIGVAATGSGKTAAFLLPLLVYISELPALSEMTKNDGPYALILAPTRELAQQIEIEARKFATPLGFTCVSIVGGHSLEEQAYNLRNGAEIVIATPGRLVDCIERRVLVLSQCCYIIMDEADRMIDLGFEEPVNKILDALPADNMKPDSQEAENARHMSQHIGHNERYRQTMMYTATMPSAVERIARKYLRRPAIVTIGNIGEAVETVEQRVEFVSGEDRRKKRMLEILSSGEFKAPIIVFVNIKRNCDAVARDIKHSGFSSVTLHGSKTQDQREAALAAIRNGSTEVLVATDLAGRGIDVSDVSLVLNFNMANNIESYTHRIGRTGRAGKSGVAITFLGTEDNDVLYDLRQMLTKSQLSRVPDELRKHEAAQQKPQRGQQKKIE